MNKYGKVLILFGVILLISAFAVSFFDFIPMSRLLYAVSYLFLGHSTFIKLRNSLKEKEFFGEATLMTVSSLGAMLVGEMAEGCMVMLLYNIGEMLEEKARKRSDDNIKKLLDISPKIAERLLPDGTTEPVIPKELEIGDTVIVKGGQIIPCDGEILEGNISVDTSSITGESKPLLCEPGSCVRCGYISLDGSVKIRVTASYEDNSFSKIIDILSNVGKRKTKSETFIRRFAGIYTPIVIFASFTVMIIGSIVTGDIAAWIYRGLIFLATSCPCAFVISVPLTFYFGIGELTKSGLLVKGSEYIEKLSKITSVAFDKTGTLTTGMLDIVSVKRTGEQDKKDIIALCASLEAFSDHPIAVRITDYAKKTGIALLPATDVRELPGVGICGKVCGRSLVCGNRKAVPADISINTSERTTNVYVVADGKLLGIIELADTIRPEAAQTVADLSRCGIKHFTMLTGDNAASAGSIADQCGITDIRSDLLPHEKVDLIREAMTVNVNGATAFVGDGLNDAPVLAVADVGIAVGGTGSEISVETADAIILGQSLLAIPRGIKGAKKLIKRVYFNIVFSLGAKLLILILALLGVANMWIAVFGDVGVMIIVILNSLRKLRI